MMNFSDDEDDDEEIDVKQVACLVVKDKKYPIFNKDNKIGRDIALSDITLSSLVSSKSLFF